MRVISRTAFFRKLHKAHIYIGLFVAIHFAIFAVTGFILLFKDEMAGGESTSAVEISADRLAPAYASIETALVKKFPSGSVLALFPDDHDSNHLHARVGLNGSIRLRGAERITYDLRTGHEISNEAKSAGFFDWVLRLHRELFLGSNGKIYLGVVGLAYVFILVSGFFIYGRFMSKRNFGEIRRGKVPKLADLHKFAGVITFGWSLVVGLSGVFLAFNGLLIKLFQYQSLRHLSEAYKDSAPLNQTSVSVSNILASVAQAKPDSVVSYISYPNTEFGINGHFLILVNGTERFSSRLSELMVANASSGKLAEVVELPWYLKIVLLSEPLHFGDYGGLPLKVIWGLFTLLSLAVAALGVMTFIQRRRKSGADAAQTARDPRPQRHLDRKEASSYLKPFAFFFCTSLALALALITDGLWSLVAILMLTVPLLALILGWRRRV